MEFRRIALFVLLLLQILSSLVISQTPTPETSADKEKKDKEQSARVSQMLDRVINEAGELRLPQNRSIVYAVSGDLLWKLDEKRSRLLFRDSANEILSFNAECEKEGRESNDRYAVFYDSCGDVRTEILPLIAKHDAELALEMLLATRPARLTTLVARTSLADGKPKSDFMNFNPESYMISEEIGLEQKFALMAAEENPDKALKLIKDSLAKGVSDNVLPLLQKLYKKDEKKAGDLAAEVVRKLTDLDLSKNKDELNMALRFLEFAFKSAPSSNAKEKKFTFSDSQSKDLANKLATTFLDGGKSMMAFSGLETAMPAFEKLLPERVALLKQKRTEILNSLPSEFVQMEERSKLANPNSTPEEIIANIPKLPNDYEKASAYSLLISKIGQIEDEARAKKLIDQIPDEKTRAQAQENFEAARIARSASSGRLDDARKLIGNLTKKKVQIQRLVALAQEFQMKGGETDVAAARSLMRDARALTEEYPATLDAIDDTMEVVKGYATVDPEIAFRILPVIIDKLNSYIGASSVLAGFEPSSHVFKKGEMVVRIKGRDWDMPLFRYMPQIQTLGKADPERMSVLADRFDRPETRAVCKINLILGFLTADKKADAPMPVAAKP
jgi:hypothetical protein